LEAGRIGIWNMIHLALTNLVRAFDAGRNAANATVRRRASTKRVSVKSRDSFAHSKLMMEYEVRRAQAEAMARFPVAR